MAVPHFSRHRGKSNKLEGIIRARLAAGEISKRFAFEIAWLEGLYDLAAQFRDEILTQPPVLAPEPVLATQQPTATAATTESKARRSASPPKGIVLKGGFQNLAALLEKRGDTAAQAAA